jgi:adenylosuccinate synthase
LLDAVALQRSLEINSVTGLCITKLDVLDTLETVKIAVGYRTNGHEFATPPLDTMVLNQCEPIYEELPGWQTSTLGIQHMDQLPKNALRYLQRIEELTGISIDMISVGPDRNETIVLRHPFD